MRDLHSEPKPSANVCCRCIHCTQFIHFGDAAAAIDNSRSRNNNATIFMAVASIFHLVGTERICIPYLIAIFWRSNAMGCPVSLARFASDFFRISARVLMS